MAYSMTGFGRGEMLFATRKYSSELKSVNSRYCDINIRMPRILNFTDNLVRKMITDRLGRGKIDVYISFDHLVFFHQDFSVKARSPLIILTTSKDADYLID